HISVYPPPMRVVRPALKVMSTAVDVVRRPAPGLVVLIYHRVGRRTNVEVDLPRDQFDRQIAFLAANATVLTLTDALARLGDVGSPPEPLVAVTFDDGTADFAEVALPVLADHGIPVTLYVATDFVERGVPFPDDGVPLSWSALGDAVS